MVPIKNAVSFKFNSVSCVNNPNSVGIVIPCVKEDITVPYGMVVRVTHSERDREVLKKSHAMRNDDDGEKDGSSFRLRIEEDGVGDMVVVVDGMMGGIGAVVGTNGRTTTGGVVIVVVLVVDGILLAFLRRSIVIPTAHNPPMTTTTTRIQSVILHGRNDRHDDCGGGDLERRGVYFGWNGGGSVVVIAMMCCCMNMDSAAGASSSSSSSSSSWTMVGSIYSYTLYIGINVLVVPYSRVTSQSQRIVPLPRTTGSTKK